jgi:hypothetical protein
MKQEIGEEMGRIAKEVSKMEKKFEKSLGGVEQKVDKLEDYLGQKI